MDIALWTASIISSLSLLVWVWLLLGRGGFWRTDQQLRPAADATAGDIEWPAVRIVVPARNEARVLPETLPTLLGQDYPGSFHIVLVDDDSEDGTEEVAKQIASEADLSHRLSVVTGEPLRAGWAGKVWALHQGVDTEREAQPDFFLLTDADIAHPPDVLRGLVLKAQNEGLALVSLMAKLRRSSPWEHMLIPAFVFFFSKLYPFRWVNNDSKATAAATGGCVFLRREALDQAGGFAPIAGAVIDDCALARLIKGGSNRHGGGRIWLGLTRQVRSVRTYNGLSGIWGMVARTAFAQLNFSSINLVGTVLAMLLVYLVPPLGVIGGLVALGINLDQILSGWLASAGFLAWIIMVWCYFPMLRWYETPRLLALLLPVTAMMYTFMTVDSARRWWQGRGGAWKGRTYNATVTDPSRPPTATH